MVHVSSREIIPKCNISMQDYCSINQYFWIRQYVSDLMSIFDSNSTPVCLLEWYHLCRACAMNLPLDDGERSTRKMTTNKTNR